MKYILLLVILLSSCSVYRVDFSTMTVSEKLEFQRQYNARQNNIYLDNGFDYWNRPGFRGFYRNQWGPFNGWQYDWYGVGFGNYYNRPIIITKPRYANTRNNNSVRSSNRSSGTTRRATVTRSSGTTRKARVTRKN